MSDPGRLSSLRIVIAVADRMPDIGVRLYETGPAVGIAKLTAYLARRSTPMCWPSTTAKWRRRSSSRRASHAVQADAV